MADGTTLANLAERWFSARAIADAHGVSKRSIERRAESGCWPSRPRTGRGGGSEYPYSALPPATQIALARRYAPPPINATHARKAKWTEARIQAAHERYDCAKQSLKDAAQLRLRALRAVMHLVDGGMGVLAARELVARQLSDEGTPATAATIARWQDMVDGAHYSDWMFLLVPAYTGRTKTAEMSEQAWDVFKADYLRLEQPSAQACYDRLARIAQAQGWPALPSLRTFTRRLTAELPRQVLVLAREGEEALMRTYPAQERHTGDLAAMSAANADGHRFDVFVRTPDGTRIVRPIIVGWQDIYSRKMLAWRLGETESSDLVRLSFADMVAEYGAPEEVWLDNGRSFAAKILTGGTPNRYRFKVKDEDPRGIITALVQRVHWVTPYHGQAKPIERAWRDFCDRIAKHPAFAGAYVGNNPTAKPENYGSRAVEWDAFEAVVREEIIAHNARTGREAKACAGRSFDATFAASYAKAPVRKASAEQLRTLLLASTAVTASAVDGSVHLAGNRYWCEALARHAGRKVVLRVDPMRLHTGVHVYGLDNAYLGYADCVASVGFADSNAAREHTRARKNYRRAAKDMLEAERRMDAAQVAAQMPSELPPELPTASVIAPLFGASPAREVEPERRTNADDVDSAGALCLEIAMARRREYEARGF